MFKMIDSTDHFSKKTGLTCTVNISKAGAAFGAAGGTVTEVANGWYKIVLTTTDTNTVGDLSFYITATGADDTDFVDQVWVRDLADLAYPATSGRSMVVDASGLVDANTVKVGPTGSGTAQTAKDIGGAVPSAAAGASGGLLISGSNSGTTTLGALTVTGVTTHTGNVVMSAGLNITQSSSNTSALVVTGNGTGHGAIITSGSGATGDGFKAVSAATNGSGMTLVKTGTGSDLNATVTPLTLAKTTNITGFNDIAATAVVSSGAITTSGGAVSTVTTLTNQLTAAAIATGIWQDTTAGDFTAASSIGKSIMNGVALGTGLTINGYTGNTPQTGDSYARIGLAGVGLTNLGDTRIANLDAAVSSRMATYTQPTGFLAATFPSGTIANTTNITAGTITTTTNLTNAPTAGDFTATMKTSLNAATPSVTVSDKTGFSLTSAYDAAKTAAQASDIPSANTIATAVLTNTMTESYPTKGSSFTLAQGIYDLVQQFNEQSISGTTMTVKKRDQSTTAKTFTLNDATNPTGITEAS